jgi:hypothetical protein
MKSSMMIICDNKELSNSDHQDYLEQETRRSSVVQSTRQNNKAKQEHTQKRYYKNAIKAVAKKSTLMQLTQSSKCIPLSKDTGLPHQC